MIANPYPVICYTTFPPQKKWPEILRHMKSKWPELAGFAGAYNGEFIHFRDGILPDISDYSEIREFSFYRDYEMYETWDWDQTDLAGYHYEGAVSLYSEDKNPEIRDSTVIETMDEINKERIEGVDYRIIGSLFRLEITLPYEPSANSFSKIILSEFGQILRS